MGQSGISASRDMMRDDVGSRPHLGPLFDEGTGMVTRGRRETRKKRKAIEDDVNVKLETNITGRAEHLMI